MLVEERGLSSRQTQYVVRTWRLGNLSIPIRVQKLQMALHAKAKAEAGYRFYALYDKIYREDVQMPQRVVHPLSKTITRRVTPELEYLQAKWAAYLPYRQATTMLKEVLPLNKGISFSGARNRIHTLGKLLDADIERDIAKLPQPATDVQVREASHVAAVSVDSAWLRSCDQLRSPGGHVNIVTGRATFTDGPPKLYAYVHKEVSVRYYAASAGCLIRMAAADDDEAGFCPVISRPSVTTYGAQSSPFE
ncbi:hypothetical protein bAD24_p00435 (plasmid) [Burkholderia sp. AD24]|nr:hypothetical protein bAD24_p00435 [Burkholderia sp. AD24]